MSKEEIVSILYNNRNMTLKEVGVLLGETPKSKQWAHYLYRTHGIKRPTRTEAPRPGSRKGITKVKVDYVLSRHPELTLPELASVFKCDQATVGFALRSLGVETSSKVRLFKLGLQRCIACKEVKPLTYYGPKRHKCRTCRQNNW